MVVSAERRIRKYEGKIDPDAVARRFELLKSRMAYGMASKIPTLVNLELTVKQICAKYGVPSYLYAHYYNVARELFKVTNTHIGDTAKAEAQLVVNKWATRGLNADILAEIAKLFGFEVTPTSWY